MYKLNLDSNRSKYLQLATNLTVLMMLIFSIVIWNPGYIWAWNSAGVIDEEYPRHGLGSKKSQAVYGPCKDDEGVTANPEYLTCVVGYEEIISEICNGTDDWECLDTHEWIVHEAIEYLKGHGHIPAGTSFDGDEFKKFLQWGVAYADNTGKKIKAGIDEIFTKSWDIDGFRHFYHPDDIHIAVIEWGGYGIPGFVGVGDLAAPEYAKQLYQRAVEFWPNGKPPLDLNTLTKTYYLGYSGEGSILGPVGAITLYEGWGRGTDPRNIWSKTEKYIAGIPSPSAESPKDPYWPAWVDENQEEEEKTAAIFLGWALHMIQDMSVYHHTKNLHGIPHQDYESNTEDMVRAKETVFSKQLPIPPVDPNNPNESGKPFCVTYASCEKRSTDCCELKEFQHCYDIFPHLAFYNLDSFDAESLAKAVAYYTWEQARKNLPYQKTPVSCFYDTDEAPPPGIPPYFSFKNEAYVKHSLDAAIKASAALIYKFITDVSQQGLPEDRFEPNDDYDKPWRLSPGSYPDLAISDKLDYDYYLIEMPYQGDLEIRIDYDNKLASIGAKLIGEPTLRFPNEQYAQGLMFKHKGIKRGKYVLQLQPGILWGAPANADVTTTNYDLHITIGEKRLDPDWIDNNDYHDYKYNDTPATAFHIPNFKYWEEKDLNIHHAGDNDYFELLAPIGYKIDVSMTFEPSEGELRLFLNNEEVKEVHHQSINLAPDALTDTLQIPQRDLRPLFNNRGEEKEPNDTLKLATDSLDARGPSINKKAVQKAKHSLSPSPTASDLSKKTLSISRCSSGRDIIRITGQPNYYSINVTQTVDFDHCRAKLSPTKPRDIFPPNTTIQRKPVLKVPPRRKIQPKPVVKVPPSTTIRPKPVVKVPPSTTIQPKPVVKVPPSTTIRPKPVVKVPPSTTIQPKPVAKVPPSTTIKPKPVVKVPPSTTIQPKPLAKVPPSTTIQPKPVLKSTVQMQRTYR